MRPCDGCQQPVPDTASYCPSCGTPVVREDTPTIDRRPPPAPRKFAASPPSSDFFSHGRFLPGTLLGDRYRIVAMLGRGGMGEVYRADDLKLGQAVALKFLPRKLAEDPSRLERFRQEVRSARQVSHPNVCRVHDIGEVEGEHFLTMEYVEGEDLSHLIRRIGALPGTKALQVARQIAAGLAAAHDKSLIHRDLKPANVMLDERGIARITDFGLAGSAEEIARGSVREGTPHYMAPEQLTGQEVTVRSDIYSLGLVLYEIFTGERAFQADSLAALVQKRQSTSSTTLSDSMAGLDPAVRQVILRCLENDPQKRPPSALSVSAALPGGDPLAAALAAGETPSPAMVAAGGEEGLIKPAHAMIALAIAILGSILNVAVSKNTDTVNYSKVEYSPGVMKIKAREMLERLGYKNLPGNGTGKYTLTMGYVNHIRKTDQSLDRWKRLAAGDPPLYLFWYRDAKQPLVTLNWGAGLVGGYLRPDDPPMSEPGMVRVTLDPQARLTELMVVPPAHDPNPTDEPYDWTPLLKEAGLDPAALQVAEPEWTPPFSSHRAAWTGSYPGKEGIPFRVEAASYGGLPVFFRKIPAWVRPPSDTSNQPSTAEVAQASLFSGVFLMVLIAAGLLARNNVRRGRGDLKGSNRLGLFVFGLLMATWAISADHSKSLAEVNLLQAGLSQAVYTAGLIWLFYLALEPWMRRRWPQMLVAWTRVLHGRVRDPLIGRDVLVAFAIGAIVALLDPATYLVRAWIGAPPLFQEPTTPAALGLTQRVLAETAWAPVRALLFGFMFLFVIMIFRLILRRSWAAVIGFVLFAATLFNLGSSWEWLEFTRSAIVFGVEAIVLVRFGLVSFVAFNVSTYLIDMASEAPVNLGAWDGWSFLIMMGLLWGIATWAFLAAMAGRRIVAEDVLEA